MKKFFAKNPTLLFSWKLVFAEIKKLKYFFAIIGYRTQNAKATSYIQTMSSIAINSSVESAVLKMMTSNATAIVTKLAAKYEFDLDEALQLALPTAVVKKEVVPRKPKDALVSEPKSSKGKGKDKEDKPKKAKTGYLLFSDSVRAEVRDELEAEALVASRSNGGSSAVMAKEVVKGIAAKWKELSEEERTEWRAQAQLQRETEEDEGEEEE